MIRLHDVNSEDIFFSSLKNGVDPEISYNVRVISNYLVSLIIENDVRETYINVYEGQRLHTTLGLVTHYYDIDHILFEIKIESGGPILLFDSSSTEGALLEKDEKIFIYVNDLRVSKKLTTHPSNGINFDAPISFYESKEEGLTNCLTEIVSSFREDITCFSDLCNR